MNFVQTQKPTWLINYHLRIRAKDFHRYINIESLLSIDALMKELPKNVFSKENES